MSQKKKLSEHCFSEDLRFDHEGHDRVREESCTEEHAVSSKAEVPSGTTNPRQHHHVLSPTANPERRPSPTVQSDSIERSQSSELKQSNWNHQAEEVSPRLNKGGQKEKNRPSRRQK
ncbi:hypothetical protein N7481_001416 [Penicillium waksmanii]|uniref:uncharacterized protein n=1 Tax=Penicillium waksmanii TaxID=69791 RepID=UPI0025490AD6|nr:uncharacterized protein N7481_001416 [Penicillium waksmanii]KAJ6001007.1 hypothetical protein N7481_001416 [Penicillium waksmanii]